ncbi:aminoacyl-tRNA hydrolase [Corynebacterium freneyi]|uniref:Peptidyl-tRNA hydrolase n=1 Tax=Corynebacterium freneyi TaxID=134034 RepID=A0ABS4U5M4_9CORY|nr:aminoacyl-tRNA hydrolase [Corynebacterium freneyi]MBP2331953.1 PTH1 family peptidyl-tRNA hydrolase [Corynebacterium freneyi]QXA53789.1 aminoacyl-tRNA hydrolase [Corynebacterium freneyi]WJZ05931.1 Peptidyl-tRNA hydrolase [Corynebacterium freneyi]
MFGRSKTPPAPSDAPPILVVGLGNPGPKYADTRHNVGQMVLDELAERTVPMPSTFSAHKRSNAEIVQTRWTVGAGDAQTERQVILAKPRTYMNVSGGPISALAKFFNVEPTDVIVVHDELDLDPGVIRLKRGGGENGHNGLRSTSKSLGTKDYMRVRIGIGRPPGRQDPADYVLRNFNAKEREELAFTLPTAAEAVELIASRGLEIAQNQVHGR